MTGEARDFSQLSDEEMMNLSPADLQATYDAEAAAIKEADALANETEEEKAARLEQEEQARLDAETNANKDGGDNGDEEGEDGPEAAAAKAAATVDDPNDDLDDDNIVDPAKAKAPAAKAKEAPATVDKAEPTADEVAVQAEEAAKLFAPFKANGRDMQIRNADEGRRLMQLGAGYNTKMEKLKPDLAIIATLRREGLLDNDKLSFLIDLHKKNPEAIGKLVKDAGVDVLELDDAKIAGYKPNNYATSQKEVELDEVFEGLKDSPKYGQLMGDVANKWDRASKDELGNNPGVLNVIHEHMNAGFYDKIVDELERKKALGQIPAGTPFLKAYAAVGDELNAAGAFAQQEAQPAKKLVTAGKEQARANREDAEKRRKAAAPTRTAGDPAPKKPIVDVWTMSDDDFKKLKF